MPGSAATSPNGKWRPSKRSHGQRPPTPSIRLHDEAGCHNDPASAVPANRPMMSTISNTFADYNIDLEEEENESTGTNSSAEDEEAYVIQVKPLPKIRLDLCPAPREEDEYRDPNRHRKKKSRRRSSSGRSRTDNFSPSKSMHEKGWSPSDTETAPVLNSSFSSTTVTDKAGNDDGDLDANRATTEFLLGTQIEQESPRSSVDKKAQHEEIGVAVDNTMVDADGFPVGAILDEQDSNESNTKKNVPPVMAPMFAPSPPLTLAIHQGTLSHQPGTGDAGSRSFPNSNAAVAPSVDYKNAKEEEEQKPNAQPRPDSIADSSSITPKTHHRKNRQTNNPKTRQTTPPRRMKDEQDGHSPKRSECKANKKEDEEQRNIGDEEDVSSQIFDWLLMICGDVSSFVSEGCMGSPKQNGIGHQLNAKTGKQNEERVEMQGIMNGGGQYDLDHFKW